MRPSRVGGARNQGVEGVLETPKQIDEPLGFAAALVWLVVAVETDGDEFREDRVAQVVSRGDPTEGKPAGAPPAKAGLVADPRSHPTAPADLR